MSDSDNMEGTEGSSSAGGILLSDKTTKDAKTGSDKKPSEVVISRLDSWSVHRICSGQVIISLAVAVKELVENALDAGAKEIIVRTRDYGSKSIEIQDNGEGILPENFESLCLKHFTSKLRDFSDLESIATFGFRGEALSSLCALGQVSITTKHTSRDIGSALTFNTEGHLVQNKPCARDTGTTVCVENIFSPLPVRHKQFMTTLKKEFTKMVHFMSGYGLITRGVSLSVVNFDDKGKRNEVLRKRAHLSYKDNIAEVFGYKEVSRLVEYQPAPIPLDEEILEEFRVTKLGIEYFQEVVIEGLISSCAHGKGRSTGDRQFLFINSRPCDHAKLFKLINQVYHQYNNSQQPFVMLNILTPQQLVDVNLTPDKRTVLLHRENVMLAMIKASLIGMYNKQATHYSVNSIEGSRQDSTLFKGSKSMDNSFESTTTNDTAMGGCLEGDVDEVDIKKNSREGVKDLMSVLRGNFELQARPKTSRNVVSEVSQSDSKSEADSSDPKSFKDRFAFQSVSTKRKIQESQLPSGSGRSKRSTGEPAPLSSFGFTRSIGKVRDFLSHEHEQSKNRIKNLLEAKRQNENKNEKSVTDTNVPKQSETDVADEEEFDELAKQRRTSVNEEELGSEGTDYPEHVTMKFVDSSIDDEVDGESMDYDKILGADNKDTSLIKDNSIEKSSADTGQCSTDISAQSPEEIYVDDVSDRHVGICKLDWNMNDLREDFKVKLEEVNDLGDKKLTKDDCRFRARISPKENSSAESELTREISKDMFERMEIIGQFNKGFVIAKLANDLFIVDQHAADEKYNFETLQATTSIDCQPLAVPQKLALAPGNEQTIMEHLAIFEKNGFRISVDEDAEWGHRLALIAVPQSGHWQMGMAEIDELIFMLNDNSHPNLINCRPAKVRSMFAMRACRRSVMVGDQLNQREMKRVVSQLSGLQHPWNCPHGRPTMRHLVNLHLVNV